MAKSCLFSFPPIYFQLPAHQRIFPKETIHLVRAVVVAAVTPTTRAVVALVVPSKVASSPIHCLTVIRAHKPPQALDLAAEALAVIIHSSSKVPTVLMARRRAQTSQLQVIALCRL